MWPYRPSSVAGSVAMSRRFRATEGRPNILLTGQQDRLIRGTMSLMADDLVVLDGSTCFLSDRADDVRGEGTSGLFFQEAVRIADLLVVCGFAFDPLAGEEASALGRLTMTGQVPGRWPLTDDVAMES